MTRVNTQSFLTYIHTANAKHKTKLKFIFILFFVTCHVTRRSLGKKKLGQKTRNIMPPKKRARTTRLPPPRCSMCRKFTSIKNSLVPSKCLKQHGSVAHRVCKKCWFGSFAKEGSSHACPGCTKKLPLTDKRHMKSKPNPNAEIIEL